MSFTEQAAAKLKWGVKRAFVPIAYVIAFATCSVAVIWAVRYGDYGLLLVCAAAVILLAAVYRKPYGRSNRLRNGVTSFLYLPGYRSVEGNSSFTETSLGNTQHKAAEYGKIALAFNDEKHLTTAVDYFVRTRPQSRLELPDSVTMIIAKEEVSSISAFLELHGIRFKELQVRPISDLAPTEQSTLRGRNTISPELMRQIQERVRKKR